MRTITVAVRCLLFSLDGYFTAMNSSDWREVVAVVNGMSLWLKMLGAKMENIASKHVSIYCSSH